MMSADRPRRETGEELKEEAKKDVKEDNLSSPH